MGEWDGVLILTGMCKRTDPRASLGLYFHGGVNENDPFAFLGALFSW